MKEARIINIMNNTQIIIDYGTYHGAQIGQKVRIIEMGDNIYDISGKKKLGSLNAIKETLEIVQIYEYFSICSKITRTTSSIFNGIGGISEITLGTKSIEELNVKKDDITNIKLPDITPIKTGDIVQIL